MNNIIEDLGISQEDYTKAINDCIQSSDDVITNENPLNKEIQYLHQRYPEVSFAKLSRIVVHVAKWKEEQMMSKAIDADVFSDGMLMPVISLKEYKEKIPNVKFGDSVKIIIIKEE